MVFRRIGKGNGRRSLPLPTQTDVAQPSTSISQPLTAKTASVTHTFPAKGPVNAITTTPDGCFVAIATNYPYKAKNFPTLTIFETRPRAIRTQITAHKSSVRGVSLTTDASFLASCDHAGLILITDAVTGAEKTRLLGHRGQIEDICLDPTGANAASAGCDTTVRYWDVVVGKSLYVLHGNAAQVSAVSIARNASLVVSAGFDGTLRGWDSRTARETFALRGHAGIVNDCATDSDARFFVSCGKDKRLLVWDSRKMQPAHSFEAENVLYGCDVAMAGSRVVVCGDGGTVKVWDTGNDVALSGLDAHDPSARIRRCAISGDGEQLVTGGADMKATLFTLPPATPSSLDLSTQVFASVEVLTEIERVFCNYFNNGIPFSTAAVVRAIEIDFADKKVSKLSTVYVGHVCVRTLLSSSETFSNDSTSDAMIMSTSFRYQKLYHKIAELITSQRSQEFAERILRDAEVAGILSASDVHSILGDAISNEYTRQQFSKWATVMNQVCEEVTSHIATVEYRLESLSFDVSSLRADVDHIEAKMKRAAKVQRYANLVKFGVALIPFVGSAAMAFLDGSATLIMSLDVESVAEMCTGLISTAGQTIVDSYGADTERETSASEHKEKQAVKVVQHILSDEFLSKIQPRERGELVKGLEIQFGNNLESLRNEVRNIVEDHTELVRSDEHIGFREVIGIANLNDGDHDGQKDSPLDEAMLVKKFRSGVGERKTLSHKKACEFLKGVVQSSAMHSDVENVSTLVSDTLIAETHDKAYYLIDEACFVRSGKSIAATLSRDAADAKWTEGFDKAAAGDTEISAAVAVRIIAAVTPHDKLSEGDVAARIKNLFGEREVLSKEEFILAAKGVPGDEIE